MPVKAIGLLMLIGAIVSVPAAAADDAAGGKRWKGDGVSWVVPEGWSQQEGGGALRFATLSTGEGEKKAEVAVSKLGPFAGGVLANVNRWRAQVGLHPISEEQLRQEATVVKAGELEAIVVHLKGEQKHIVGAILPTQDATWFFKMLTTPALAEKHASVVPAVVKSVRFEAKE